MVKYNCPSTQIGKENMTLKCYDKPSNKNVSMQKASYFRTMGGATWVQGVSIDTPGFWKRYYIEQSGMDAL